MFYESLLPSFSLYSFNTLTLRHSWLDIQLKLFNKLKSVITMQKNAQMNFFQQEPAAFHKDS